MTFCCLRYAPAQNLLHIPYSIDLRPDHTVIYITQWQTEGYQALQNPWEQPEAAAVLLLVVLSLRPGPVSLCISHSRMHKWSQAQRPNGRRRTLLPQA